jgi:hypothetical protein
MYRRSKPIVPRNGHALSVGIVARISGCQDQKDISLEDQEAHGRQVIEDIYQGPVEYRVIATRGKGERLDRPELAETEAMLRTRELDFLVAEDIGRIIRGGAAVRLCGIAVDHGTRVLAPNDGIDTDESNWEEDVLSACRDHVGHNAHTSKRIKFKMMNRFKNLGEATSRQIYGHIKPPSSKSFDDWTKDPAAEKIYREWLDRLTKTPNCSALADWLNEQKVPTGPYARKDQWDGPMVRRVTANPLLKGWARRGVRHSVKHNETGRRVSVKNPSGPQFRHCPHLGFWTEDEFDAVNKMLDERNARYKHEPANGVVPGVGSRKRTRFPGQHARCLYCGRQYVWGGNGVTGNLMCRGSREWRCWNSVGFCGALAGERVVEAITAELYRLDGFDDQFRELVEKAAAQGGVDLAGRWGKLRRCEETTAREKKNLCDAVAAYGP